MPTGYLGGTMFFCLWTSTRDNGDGIFPARIFWSVGGPFAHAAYAAHVGVMQVSRSVTDTETWKNTFFWKDVLIVNVFDQASD